MPFKSHLNEVFVKPTRSARANGTNLPREGCFGVLSAFAETETTAEEGDQVWGLDEPKIRVAPVPRVRLLLKIH